MVKSMTGYGRGENETQEKAFTVEIRSVNHRFCEVVVRMPKYYIALEDRIRKLIQEYVSRGRLDVFVNVSDRGRGKKTIQVDKDLAMAYYNALRELGESLGIVDKPGIIDIARLPDVILMEDIQDDLDIIWPVLQKAVEEAVENIVEMRSTEGLRLREDLLMRIGRLEQYTETITGRAPAVVSEFRDKLKTRLKELDEAIDIDEARLASELAVFADRSNISEELVRLRSHFTELRATLSQDEPAGRKLDFLVQELNREFNTIGSKANDAAISSIIITAKSEVEKIREQVQNIE
ncbi:YicC/YloC family endoribonuclease [Phosphitispora sp. TUW77]|uniref:YicC/YloC family endoribonuclease n=1 Tax=Phosphitispora sp. TUW77 TaxID=3152361 RepID=UPI003AB3B4C7